MALNNFDDDQFNPDLGLGGDEPFSEPPQPEKRPSGRSFLLAIGIIGVILILALILLLLIAPGIISQQRATNLEQAAQINAANTATAMAATALAQQQAVTSTPAATKVPPTATPRVIATGTPVVAGAQLSASELATVQALQTQVAAAPQGGGASGTTQPLTTPTALPKTGFADEYGIPGMVGLAAILIAVVLLSRKLRTSPH
ncbi:MAG: LPXTG cell wall anchor domain-containing protein [Anaerolineaceae bacterium]